MLPDPADIHRRYEATKERIEQACIKAGRSVDGVTLVAVSKTFPTDFIRVLYNLGHRHFGENKVQELAYKASFLRESGDCGDLHWHMIGHLQRNKAREVVLVADVFHALDSDRLAEELNRRAEAADRSLSCFVQVNISAETSKHGLGPDDVHAFITRTAKFERLTVVGLMAMARPVFNPEDVRPEFAKMKNLLDSYPAHDNPRADLKYLSMGMSHDFEVAIAEGATHIRIGSSIFGPRAGMVPAGDMIGPDRVA